MRESTGRRASWRFLAVEGMTRPKGVVFFIANDNRY